MVVAHLGVPAVGPSVTRHRREETEALEAALLAPGATRAIAGGDRARPEAPDEERTCFQRDLDRVLHSRPFRRLAGKTQVFVAPADHQRTRLTHALEVAQVSRAIARASRLNEDLAEAAATAHDVGHGPFGHASEEVFAAVLPEGFDHARFGADVVLAPFNLCRETLDAVRNHSWSRPAPATPEAEVVAWADRIAYVCHDFEDAVAAGILTNADLPPAVRDVAGTTRSGQLARFIDAVVENVATTGWVGMASEPAEALAEFRRCNDERIYLRPDSLEQARRAQSLLRALLEWFIASPQELPVADGAELTHLEPGSEAAARASVEYVAGMTDRFATRCAKERLGWSADRAL